MLTPVGKGEVELYKSWRLELREREEKKERERERKGRKADRGAENKRK